MGEAPMCVYIKFIKYICISNIYISKHILYLIYIYTLIWYTVMYVYVYIYTQTGGTSMWIIPQNTFHARFGNFFAASSHCIKIRLTFWDTTDQQYKQNIYVVSWTWELGYIYIYITYAESKKSLKQLNTNSLVEWIFHWVSWQRRGWNHIMSHNVVNPKTINNIPFH